MEDYSYGEGEIGFLQNTTMCSPFEQSGYVAAPPMAADDLFNMDKDDESLNTIKRLLLGENPSAIIDRDDPRQVLMRTLTLVVGGRDNVTLDLNDIDSPKTLTLRIKEKARYKLQFGFYVQREMVQGLRYTHKVYRLGAKIGNEKIMLGSFAPSYALRSYSTHQEKAPSGIFFRGTYKVVSQLTDDDGIIHHAWTWNLVIAQDW